MHGDAERHPRNRADERRDVKACYVALLAELLMANDEPGERKDQPANAGPW
jgi:hypothetical protein